jgi:hypothetical protein
MAKAGEKTDLKNIELAKQLSRLRDLIDIHRITGLNVERIHSAGVSRAFLGRLHESAHDGLAMGLCRIYESSGRNDLNSIPGVIELLPSKRPNKAVREELSEFGRKYSNVAEPDEIHAYILATYGLFTGLNSRPLARLKRYRDTIGAHSDHKAKRDPLPSHDEFERLFDFALDFYGVVSKVVVGVGPAHLDRAAGRGLMRLLESAGVADLEFDFPEDT